MLMADTMAVFFSVLGVMLAFVGLWLLARGLWPRSVEAACDRFERGLVIPFLAGLVPTAIALVMAAVLANAAGKLGGLLAISLVCTYVTFASVGVAGLATRVGLRLGSSIDASQPWRATLRGAIVLVLAFLAPVLGWFVLLPAATIVGAGAATLGLLRSRKPAEVPAPQFPQSVAPADSHAEYSRH
jgi:uncharacterized membrane protein